MASTVVSTAMNTNGNLDEGRKLLASGQGSKYFYLGLRVEEGDTAACQKYRGVGD